MGDPSDDDTQELVRAVYGGYKPSKVVAVGMPAENDSATIPLLAGRSQLEQRATAYVCRRFACQQPVNTPQALAAQLHTP